MFVDSGDSCEFNPLDCLLRAWIAITSAPELQASKKIRLGDRIWNQIVVRNYNFELHNSLTQ